MSRVISVANAEYIKNLLFDDVSVGLNKVTKLMKDMGIYVR